jgi:replication factor C small subunit
LAHELYKDDVKGNFLELNASDERGIDVVRGKIKDFARSLSLSNVPFKIIFLDEADALTPDAQHALRRTMEKYSSITRFILSCNYSSKIIEPLQSRVSVFRFSPLTKQDVITLIKRVEQAEGLSIDEDVYDLIYYLSEGDMRRVLNIMQGSAVFGTHITREIVLKITSRAEPEKVRTMMEQALNGEFKQARDTLNELFINYGMSGEDIITQMFKEVDNLNVSERIKVIIMDKIGEYDFRMVEGANERIQLEALLAYLALLGERLKKA